MRAEPFTIHIADDVIADLRERIARTRWPDEVEDSGWDYGSSLSYMRDLVSYWGKGFDWRPQEARLNAVPHFTADVDGTTLHFIHVRGNGPSPMPLLMLHGWPSSFVQMLPMLSLLTNPSAHGGDAADAFDVVVASLPGYGFSSRPTRRGMGVGTIARMMTSLMRDVLGYERFAVRGSDLGAGVAEQMAIASPGVLFGMHAGGTNPWIMQMPEDLSPAEREFVANVERWSNEEMAYARLQSSKPQTLSYGLNDSPAGLAAWIIEKFRRWRDCDGDVERAFSREDLLTNVTIYWVTGTIGSSIRLYYETLRDPEMQWGRADVPTAMAMPPRDMFPTPREWAERTSRIDRWTELPAGGHVPEWEQPQLMAEDIRAFFRELR